jgi:hypothetical protein
MAELFHYRTQDIVRPLTADRAELKWGADVITSATNVTIQYQQQINRRRVIGGQVAVRWGSQPTGTLTCQRILTTNPAQLFSSEIWNQCSDNPPKMELTLGKGCGEDGVGEKVIKYEMTGAVVSQYQVQAEAEGLTVIDNVVVEFMQLIQS